MSITKFEEAKQSFLNWGQILVDMKKLLDDSSNPPSEEMYNTVENLTTILMDPTANSETKSHAADVMVEIFYPEICLKVCEQWRDEKNSSEYKEAEAVLDEQEKWFIDNVANLMKQKSISVEMLAGQSGLSETVIVHLLKHDFRPSQKTVAAICASLGVSVESIWRSLEEVEAFIAHKNHHNGCPICLKAARLRFAGGTTDQINSKRCDEGRELALKSQQFYKD